MVLTSAAVALPKESDVLVTFRAAAANPWLRVLRTVDGVATDGWLWLHTGLSAGMIASVRLVNGRDPDARKHDGTYLGTPTPIDAARAHADVRPDVRRRDPHRHHTTIGVSRFRRAGRRRPREK